MKMLWNRNGDHHHLRDGSTLPRISIVTPSFNQGAFLKDAIDSVIWQDYPNIEYIIMDGGSTDDSVAIMQEYDEQLEYWESGPDKGQTDALARGFEKATGDILCWLNSDDALLPGSLEAVGRTYLSQDGPEVITGNVCYIDENDYIKRCVRVPRQIGGFTAKGVWNVQAPAIFFKRTTYEEIGGLDVSLEYSMDLDLWYRYWLANARFVHIPRYLGVFRHHTHSKTIEFRSEFRKVLEHPETERHRKKYIPGVTAKQVRLARKINQAMRIARLDYARGWLDKKQFQDRTWQQVFTPQQ